MTALLYPAIDLLEGRAVRLHQGDRKTARVWSQDPAAQAREFVQQGAVVLHVVDLDAAFGGPRQLELIGRIAQAAAPAVVQVGGGIRDVRAGEETLAAGAGRIILGTAAIEHPALAATAVERFGQDRVESTSRTGARRRGVGRKRAALPRPAWRRISPAAGCVGSW